MLVAPPPLFSTTTCWPHCAESCAETMRAIASVPPPGGNGTTIRTKRAGQVCASALPMPSASERMSAAVSRSFMRSQWYADRSTAALRLDEEQVGQATHKLGPAAHEGRVGLRVDLARPAAAGTKIDLDVAPAQRTAHPARVDHAALAVGGKEGEHGGAPLAFERDLAPQLAKAFLRRSAEERILDVGSGGSHRLPVLVGERGCGAAENFALLVLDVTAVVDQIGGGGGLDLGARNERAVDDRGDLRAQRFARVRDDAVLLLQARERQLQVRKVARQAGEGGVLARVMHAVTELAEIGEDVEHQRVVRALAQRKEVELALQPSEEPPEVHVLGMPSPHLCRHTPILRQCRAALLRKIKARAA